MNTKFLKCHIPSCSTCKRIETEKEKHISEQSTNKELSEAMVVYNEQLAHEEKMLRRMVGGVPSEKFGQWGGKEQEVFVMGMKRAMYILNNYKEYL